MLHPQTLEFLKGIEDFNEKKFFDLYKPLYLQIKEKFENIISFLIKEISKFDDQIIGTELKKSTFRIYKDMRFPRNRKTPYKNNLGASISLGGKRSEYAGYYIHIQNNASFFSGGTFFVQPRTANTIRKYIYKNWKEFKKIITNKDFVKTFGIVFSYHPKLKRIPKEFDPKHPSAKYLIYRDRLINKEIPNRQVLSKNYHKKLLEYAKIAKPFNTFINKAIKSESISP
ncbi:MAG TPA: DUF2461 domain-containing protein [Candidatus Absconditabacterales bacterium]|nr:DUF2461 domain-containing protein [Candidatus Absconditabacterales bacterium]